MTRRRCQAHDEDGATAECKRHTSCYAGVVKRFSWNAGKNEHLKKERQISFEEVVFHIQQGDLLDILEHPDPKRFGRQRIFLVRINEYVYLVPFVESPDETFLKTIIPSRKMTRKYFKQLKTHGKTES